MSDGQVASLVFSILVLVLVASSLISRRLPIGQTLKFAGIWIAIFAVGIVLFSFRDQAGDVMQKVRRQLNPSEPVQAGGSVRILRGDDGHYSVSAKVNGRTVRFLVDTGATTSTMSRSSALAAGVDVPDSGFGVMVETASGTAMMRRARIRELAIGSIRRDDVAILVSDDIEDLNLLGMNYLSSLSAWRVEGRELILTP
jgi:aspartyl protease family protein